VVKCPRSPVPLPWGGGYRMVLCFCCRSPFLSKNLFDMMNHVVPCCAVLCCAVPCCVVLCHAVPLQVSDVKAKAAELMDTSLDDDTLMTRANMFGERQGLGFGV